MLQQLVQSYITSLHARESEQGESKHNTIAAYTNDLSQFCAYLDRSGTAQWAFVTTDQIAAYVLAMRETRGYNPVTISRKLAAIKAFFRYLCNEGVISTDPTEKLKHPHLERPPSITLSAEQIGAVLRQVNEGTAEGRRDLAMLFLITETGMRASEIVALDVVDFSHQHSVVRCIRGRGEHRRERTLSLSPTTSEAVHFYLSHARSSLVRNTPGEQALFVNHRGERLTRQGFWLVIKGYAQKAGVSEITPRMLRRSLATHLLQNGSELRTVQEILGHAHSATTQVYVPHAPTPSPHSGR